MARSAIMPSVRSRRDLEFAAVVQSQWATVRQVLRRRGIRGADIDDLTQVVFVVALEHFDKLPANLDEQRAWFSEIAKRRAFDWHGNPWNRRMVRVDSEELAENAGESTLNVESLAMLGEMLDRLPARYHEIVKLRAEQYEIYEIAEKCGLPWSTVNSRWERACEEAVGFGNG
jgi:RNA polymerase sigma factor (sigma-70 family)